MVTPSGRFRPDTRLCLSMSDYHPESWNPSWSLATVLTGLLSFMVESTPTTGAIETTTSEKLRLAAASLAWNKAQEEFNEHFPDIDEIVASAALKAKPPLKQPEPEPEPEPLTPREPAPQPEPEPSREDESAAALARLGALRDELAECSAHVAA